MRDLKKKYPKNTRLMVSSDGTEYSCDLMMRRMTPSVDRRFRALVKAGASEDDRLALMLSHDEADSEGSWAMYSCSKNALRVTLYEVVDG
jgi:hypothetical protein